MSCALMNCRSEFVELNPEQGEERHAHATTTDDKRKMTEQAMRVIITAIWQRLLSNCKLILWRLMLCGVWAFSLTLLMSETVIGRAYLMRWVRVHSWRQSLFFLNDIHRVTPAIYYTRIANVIKAQIIIEFLILALRWQMQRRAFQFACCIRNSDD